ncbi:MAG TPA: 3'-5' exonuclease, partial [Beutenbergiaceae bacterium]|nr:3'-5' exonuclease [Beutenbergiaceae bacterium]
ERHYLRIPRPGRGTRLSRGDRRKVWEAVRTYRAHASADGTTDWGEKAMIAASYLDAQVALGNPRPADHVLVDETQDLRPTHLHFVRALVSEGKNDLFLADDAHQRIYAPKVTLSHYGINIRGRSRRLTLNYRTTAQNFAYALGVLDGVEYTGMDGEEVTIEGYRSARSGVPPSVHACQNQTEEYDAIAQQIRSWPTYEGHTVGVLCGTTREAEAWVRALGEREVKAKLVGRDAPAELPEVSVMTRHRAKGMEFTRVALVGMGEGAQFPGADSDPDDAGLRERSLIYVGATRARDALAISWVGQPHAVLTA